MRGMATPEELSQMPARPAHRSGWEATLVRASPMPPLLTLRLEPDFTQSALPSNPYI